MLDIKRLHEAHKEFPNNPRVAGKTTYCYDYLLRAAQTEEYLHLAYITTNLARLKTSFKGFLQFLDSQGQYYVISEPNKIVYIENSEIMFITRGTINKSHKFNNVVIDE